MPNWDGQRTVEREGLKGQGPRRSTIFSVVAIGTSSLQSVTLRRGTRTRPVIYISGVCRLHDLFSLSSLFFFVHILFEI